MADTLDLEEAVTTLDAAGRLLGISGERVRQLMAQGYIPRNKRGRVLLSGAVQGYVRYLKEIASRNSQTASDQRVRDARAAEIELRIAERRRDLVAREEAEATNAFVVGAVNEEMNGLAARLTRDVSLRRQYEGEINGAKARIAKALEVAADCIETGRELPFTDADPDA